MTVTTRDLLKRKQQFIESARRIHGTTYQYDNIDYINGQTKVAITCLVHGGFNQTPRNHLNGQGCKQCATAKMKSTVEQVIAHCNEVHNNKYQYDIVDPSRVSTNKINIICPTHGQFTQRLPDHMSGHGCIKCSSSGGASNAALSWLVHVTTTEGIEIQHAGNGSEHRIKGVGFVDGFCKTTNTVYEFHGDVFHGNPTLYHPSDNCHPFDKTLTAGQLYQRTLAKDKKITELGYNLVTLWESEFKTMNIPVATFDKSQLKFMDMDYPAKLVEFGLEIIGTYTGSKNKHQLKCLGCGSVHSATPVSKVWVKKRYPNSYGCPECNHKRKNGR